MKKGLLVIISSPTGGGKDSVISSLLKIFPNSTRIVTTTSRKPRPSDAEGETYNFISESEFKEKIAAGYFLEYNYFVGNFYGTPKEYVEGLISKYDLVFTNLDVNGKKSLEKLNFDHLSIFLLPEDMDVLRKRARERGGLTEDVIENRIRTGLDEIEKSVEYDHRVVNVEGKMDETVAKIAEIVRTELKKRGNS